MMQKIIASHVYYQQVEYVHMMAHNKIACLLFQLKHDKLFPDTLITLRLLCTKNVMLGPEPAASKKYFHWNG